MKEKLIKLLNNSYSPYSKYKVSAIVVMKDGIEFNGVNVENASYGVTICAERCAIDNAIAAGYKRYDFEELYIMDSGEEIGMPCFICRQVISEMFEKDKKVTCIGKENGEVSHTVEELCPFPFSDADLI